MSKVLDFDVSSKGFEVVVDVGKSKPVACVTLLYPNETQVIIRGDGEVVKQVVDRLDGLTIEYSAHPKAPITGGDNNE